MPEHQRNYPKCADCGSTASYGSTVCRPCADVRLARESNVNRVDIAFEKLKEIVADHRLPDRLPNAINELICAQIEYRKGA